MTAENPVDTAGPAIPESTDPVDNPQQLWPGDTGSLSLESRRALVQLLKGPLITSVDNSRIWSAILTDTDALRSRLADVFLDLVLDEDAGIAFTRMVDPGEDLTVPQVLRTNNLSHIDTLILLQLRSELGMAQPGERVIVDVEELRQQVGVYRGVEDRNEAGFDRRFDAAVKRIRNTYNLLNPTETEGRLVVSPVLRHLFDVDTVVALRTEYERFARPTDSTDDQGDEE